MSAIKKVQTYLDKFNLGLKAIEFEVSTHSSELAAQALGVEVGQIAKSLVFMAGEKPVLVVTSGDMKVKEKKLKQLMQVSKVRFAAPEVVLELTGYPVGGVCPVALNKPMEIFIDSSLERFNIVYAAAGTPNSALPVTVDQLLKITGGQKADLA